MRCTSRSLGSDSAAGGVTVASLTETQKLEQRIQQVLTRTLNAPISRPSNIAFAAKVTKDRVVVYLLAVLENRSALAL